MNIRVCVEGDINKGKLLLLILKSSEITKNSYEMCKYYTFLFHHVLLNPSFLSFLYGGYDSYFKGKSGGEPQREDPFALHSVYQL